MKPLEFFAHFVPDLFAALLTCYVASLIPWDIENILLSAFAKGLYVCAVMFSLKVLVNRFIYQERVNSFRDVL